MDYVPRENIILTSNCGFSPYARVKEGLALVWNKLEQMVRFARVINEFGLSDEAISQADEDSAKSTINEESTMSKFDVNSIKGIVPPIATPINKDESVDETGMRNLVNFLIDHGAHGLFVLGGTGEFYTFPDREKARAIEIVVDETRGRVPVFAGITDLSTRRTIENAQVAQEKGADFLVSMPPFFFSMKQEWHHSFFTAIADETDTPLMLYNILTPIHTNVRPETVRKLSERPDIVGMKDSEEFGHVQDVVFATRENDFKVLSGQEYHLYACLNVGAVGGVLMFANVCPRLCVDLYEKTVAGNKAEAISLQKKLNQLLADLGAANFSSGWGIVKMSLSIRGIYTTQKVIGTGE